MAAEACRLTPGCEYIGVCNNKDWSDRHPDSVQLYKGPLVPNADWEACKGVPLAPPSAAGVVFLLLVVLGSALYVGGGVVIGSRAGDDRSLKCHPHYRRWIALRGLVSDGVSFSKGRRRGGGGSGGDIGAGGGGGAGKEPLLREHQTEPRGKKQTHLDLAAGGEIERRPGRESAGKSGKHKRKSGGGEKSQKRSVAEAAPAGGAEGVSPGVSRAAAAPAAAGAAEGTSAGDGALLSSGLQLISEWLSTDFGHILTLRWAMGATFCGGNDEFCIKMMVFFTKNDD